MPAGRRTRSGRAAPAASTKRVRTKGGCLTCRIRRKKCDESRDHLNGGCETCARLHIECLGYSTKRPEWLKGTRVDDYKRKIKHFLADHNAKSSSRGQDDAFLYLNHLRESQVPPRHHSESAHSDTDSDTSSCVDVKFQEPSSSYVLSSPTATLDLPSTWNWPYEPSPVDPYAPWPQVFCADPYGSDDAEGSPVSEESAFGLPVLVDLPTCM